jgi:prevent-host-death family protein
MSIIINEQDAKAKLSQLLQAVKDGTEVIITSENIPVAKLVPLATPGRKRKPGSMPELSAIPPEFFFDSLPEDELTAWE